MDDKREHKAPGRERRRDETERQSSGSKVPPADRQTPGEGGEHGGGLRGA